MVEIETKPGRSPRGSQRRGQRTRRAILAATLRLIARRGLGAVTFRDVADQAGVSLGVVTYHFHSRRDLLTAAFVRHLETTDAEGLGFSQSLERQGRGKPPSLDELTEGVLALLRRFVEDDRDGFVAGHELTLELSRDTELAASIQDALASHREVVTRMVSATGASEPELEGEILSAAMEGLALKWLAHRDEPGFEEHLRRIVRHLMARLAPRR